MLEDFRCNELTFASVTIAYISLCFSSIYTMLVRSVMNLLFFFKKLIIQIRMNVIFPSNHCLYFLLLLKVLESVGT